MMCHFRFLIVAGVLALSATGSLCANAASLPGDLQPLLRETASVYTKMPEDPHRSAMLGFYGAQDFRPIWVEGGAASPRIKHLIETIRNAGSHGLIAVDYSLPAIEKLLPLADTKALAQLEFLLTQAALQFGTDLKGGRIASLNLPADIRIVPRPLDMGRLLHDLSRAEDPSAVLNALAPADPAYAELRHWLSEYRLIKSRGGWRSIPSGPTMEPGSVDPRIPALRRRLAITDRADSDAPDLENPDFYDPALAAAAIRFQIRHGLSPDGRIGRRTLAALNRSVEARIAQIAVNLDRLRAQSHIHEPSYIEINVPGFNLRAVEAGQTRLSMPVVVGREARSTPIFSSRVTEVIFNPTWTVPTKLVREDILPRLRANPQALVDLGFRFYRGWGDERVEIDPRTVDWRRVGPRSMPYWVRQDPGPKNALGQIRLTLPNIYDVFLHDTPDRHYFSRAERALSSGCVRLERPLDLAEWVLRQTPGWTHDAIFAASADPLTKHVSVRRPIPVHLVYFTAFTMNGDLHLREDIYGIDARFVAGIEKRPLADFRLPREGVAPALGLTP